jgi:hypothetical protein
MSLIADIIEFPTSIENVHESCYRSHQTLDYIMDMVRRGDSKETIEDIYLFLKEYRPKKAQALTDKD